jgi:hypothetical protein
MSRRVSFSILPAQHEEAERYAIQKGFGHVASLARYAMFHLMRQYPIDSRKHTRKGGEGKNIDPQGESAAEVHPGGPGGNPAKGSNL